MVQKTCGRGKSRQCEREVGKAESRYWTLPIPIVPSSFLMYGDDGSSNQKRSRESSSEEQKDAKRTLVSHDAEIPYSSDNVEVRNVDSDGEITDNTSVMLCEADRRGVTSLINPIIRFEGSVRSPRQQEENSQDAGTSRPRTRMERPTPPHTNRFCVRMRFDTSATCS